MKMESLSMGSSIDLNEHHFNQHIDQQHMQQTASHLKHHQIMSNIFKRNMNNNRSNNYERNLDYNSYHQHKDTTDIKPYNHLMHHHSDDHHSNEIDAHHDDIDHNDLSANEDNDNAYNNDVQMLSNNRHNSMGENLSLATKKLNDSQHYCHLPQQSQETL